MPDPALPRIYWDACVFLAYINGMADRLPHLDAFLTNSGKDHQLVTSAISLVEVAFGKAEQDGRALDDETERNISTLWDSPRIHVVEFFPLLAEEARALIRQGLPRGWVLKPLDAVHLVTARRLGVAEFHTYDEKLFRYGPDTGLVIQEPIHPNPELPYPVDAPSPAEAAETDESN